MLPQFSNNTAFKLLYFPIFRFIRNFKNSWKYRIGFTRHKCAITKKTETVTASKSYMKWKGKDQFNIGDYALKNGNTATIRKFKPQFPGLKD